MAGAALLAGPARAAPLGWDGWAARFVAPEGRVVDDGQAGISHSEGQGYGLVLAEAAGDADRFEAIRAWTDDHLARRRDPLLAWRWTPGEGITDYNNASDGDLFYAWGLLRGARRWGRADLAARATDLARALAAICLAPDPRGPGEVLLPGAEAFADNGTLTLNPSYWMPRALHDLAALAGEPRLAGAAETGAGLVWDMAAAGPVPDWVALDADGWRPAPAFPPVSGYEAMRVAPWLVWSGRAGHPAVARARQAALGDGLRLPGLGGAPDAPPATDPGYGALWRLAACAGGETVPEAGGEPASYYPATLAALAAVAAREAGLACG